MKKGLTNKQLRFCEEYAVDLNGTQAAIRAGYRENTAYSTASEILSKPEIQKRISEIQAEISKRNQVNADDLINEFKSIIGDNIKNYLDFKKTRRGIIKVKLKDNIADLDLKNIQQLHIGPAGEIRLRLYSRDNALVQLGKHIGLFNDDQTIRKNLKTILKDLTDKHQLTEDQLKKIAELLFNEQKKFLKLQ